jgi:hypothetical protein
MALNPIVYTERIVRSFLPGTVTHVFASIDP